METLLVAAIIVMALAVLVQAGSLLAMYVMTRRVVNNVNSLVNESQKLMPPLQRVTTNLESVSQDLSAMGKDARTEMQRVQNLVADTETTVRNQVEELRSRINDTVEEVQERITAPVREWSAIASGVAAGVRTFFSRRRPEATFVEIELQTEVRDDISDTPAA